MRWFTSAATPRTTTGPSLFAAHAVVCRTSVVHDLCRLLYAALWPLTRGHAGVRPILRAAHTVHPHRQARNLHAAIHRSARQVGEGGRARLELCRLPAVLPKGTGATHAPAPAAVQPNLTAVVGLTSGPSDKSDYLCCSDARAGRQRVPWRHRAAASDSRQGALRRLRLWSARPHGIGGARSTRWHAAPYSPESDSKCVWCVWVGGCARARGWRRGWCAVHECRVPHTHTRTPPPPSPRSSVGAHASCRYCMYCSYCAQDKSPLFDAWVEAGVQVH